VVSIDHLAFAALVGIALLAVANVVLALAISDMTKARFPTVHNELGSLGTISGGWSWTRFIWSRRSTTLGDRTLRRTVLATRLIQALYTPLFFSLVVLIFWAGVAA
jgi:hypothetical protein